MVEMLSSLDDDLDIPVFHLWNNIIWMLQDNKLSPRNRNRLCSFNGDKHE